MLHNFYNSTKHNTYAYETIPSFYKQRKLFVTPMDVNPHTKSYPHAIIEISIFLPIWSFLSINWRFYNHTRDPTQSVFVNSFVASVNVYQHAKSLLQTSSHFVRYWNFKNTTFKLVKDISGYNSRTWLLRDIGLTIDKRPEFLFFICSGKSNGKMF